MPEAAEVKLNVDFLNRTLKDKTIIAMTLNSGRFEKKVPKLWHLIMLELMSYPGVKVTRIESKGKLIWGEITFSPTVVKYFTCSLAMSGSWTDKDQKHNHMTFHLQNSPNVHFNDPRRFGTLAFYNSIEDINLKLLELGHDFFKEETINSTVLHRIDKIKPEKQVCEVLMDQTIFCGVGNYIKNEALHKTKIHPATLWNRLTDNQVDDLFVTCAEIIHDAYEEGGASFKTFKDSDGDLSGKYQLHFEIYGKKSLEDGFPTSKDYFNDGRASFYDPRVQILNT